MSLFVEFNSRAMMESKEKRKDISGKWIVYQKQKENSPSHVFLPVSSLFVSFVLSVSLLFSFLLRGEGEVVFFALPICADEGVYITRSFVDDKTFKNIRCYSRWCFPFHTVHLDVFHSFLFNFKKKKKRLNSICKRTKEKKQRIPMLLLWCLLLLFLLCNVVIESLDRQEEKTDRKQKYLHIMFFTYIIYIYTHIEERSKKPCTHIQCHWKDKFIKENISDRYLFMSSVRLWYLDIRRNRERERARDNRPYRINTDVWDWQLNIARKQVFSKEVRWKPDQTIKNVIIRK